MDSRGATFVYFPARSQFFKHSQVLLAAWKRKNIDTFNPVLCRLQDKQKVGAPRRKGSTSMVGLVETCMLSKHIPTQCYFGSKQGPVNAMSRSTA